MDQSIMYRDPELEASFSFSGCDFINSCVFSDVEDGDNDDEYIEIAIEKPTKHADYNDGYDVDDVDGLELRLSFSSSVPFLELSNNNNNTGLSRTTTVESLGCESIETVTTPSSSTSSSTSTSTLSCSSSATYWAHQPSSTTTKRKVQFRSVNRLLGSFLSIPRTPSEIVDKSDNNSPQHESTKQVANHTNTTDHLDLLETRKSRPKITKTSSSGIMMKLLIKCRSINIRTLLASLVKPYQIIINAPGLQGGATCGGQKKKRSSNNKTTSSSSLGSVMPFEKWSEQRDKANSNNGERSSRVFEMNMDAIRGVLESMSTITSLGRRDKKIIKRSSPPSTNKSVTAKQGNPNESKIYATTDNSIQAAIAHCKTSFGQPSDFCF